MQKVVQVLDKHLKRKQGVQCIQYISIYLVYKIYMKNLYISFLRTTRYQMGPMLCVFAQIAEK